MLSAGERPPDRRDIGERRGEGKAFVRKRYLAPAEGAQGKGLLAAAELYGEFTSLRRNKIGNFVAARVVYFQ